MCASLPHVRCRPKIERVARDALLHVGPLVRLYSRDPCAGGPLPQDLVARYEGTIGFADIIEALIQGFELGGVTRASIVIVIPDTTSALHGEISL